MRQFALPTWKCVACGYTQDFDPTASAQHQYFNADKFFPIEDIAAGECPNCALQGTRKVQLAQDSTVVRVAEMSDIDTSDMTDAEIAMKKSDLAIGLAHWQSIAKEVTE